MGLSVLGWWNPALEVMKRQHIKKQRHSFANKGPSSQSYGFSSSYPIVITSGCESWTIQKAELWRIDAFEMWCWRRLLRVPWTERRSNRSILKEISPGCSLEGLMLKLKLQYFGHLMRRTDLFEKTPMLRNIEGRRRRGRQRMRQEYWSELPSSSPFNMHYHMDKPWQHYTKRNKPGTKEKILCDSTYMKYLS